MILSEKTSSLDKFVWFGFWDKGVRESEKSKCKTVKWVEGWFFLYISNMFGLYNLNMFSYYFGFYNSKGILEIFTGRMSTSKGGKSNSHILDDAIRIYH